MTVLEHPLSPKDLAQKCTRDPSPALIESCGLLLKAAARHDEGTPMACSFATVGILEKKRVLKVHKVIFYPA